MDKRVNEKKEKIILFLNENKGLKFSALKLSVALRIDLRTIHRILNLNIPEIKKETVRENHPKRKPTNFYYI